MLPLSLSRTLGILAHVDAGKTTVSERMLFYAGRIHRVGDIDCGDTHLDTSPEERAKGITISAAATTFSWTPRVGLGAGLAHRVQLLDTPGHVDFGVEVERALSVLDGAVVVFDAHKGVEPQTEAVWRQAERHRVPRIGFINKMDKPGADWARALRSIRERLGVTPVAVAWPIGAGATFSGVVDLRTGEALRFVGEAGRDVRVESVPEAMEAEVRAARWALVEALADHDDEVFAAFVAGELPSAESCDRAVRAAVASRTCLPVLPGAALQDKGVQPLLDAAVQWLPSPADRPPFAAFDAESVPIAVAPDPEGPLAAIVFKSVSDRHAGTLVWLRVLRGSLTPGAAVVSGAGRRARVSRLLRLDGAKLQPVDGAGVGDVVAATGLGDVATGESLCAPGAALSFGRLVVPEPVLERVVGAERRVEQDRVNAALHRFAAEDPSLALGVDPETGRMLLRGQGELHLEVVLSRLTRELGVAVRTGEPRVAWRETPASAHRVRFRYVRQNGGTGAFAVVELTVAPGARGSGFVFADEVVGGALPRAFVAAVEKGARDAAGMGVAAPVTDVVVTVHDGDTHVKDSSPAAFELAGLLAFREALTAAGVIGLEPRVHLEVRVPEAALGAVLGDLAGRGASVADLVGGVESVITANAALRRIFGYVAALRSLTQGRGHFAVSPAGYAPIDGV